MITYTLSDMARLEGVVDPADSRRRDPLGVINPVAARHKYLRTTLRAGGARDLRRAIARLARGRRDHARLPDGPGAAHRV